METVKAGPVEPEVIKAGDDSGNRMVARFTLPTGAVVHGIGIPQAWKSPLGPTWSYVVEADKLTLIDAGCNGSIQYLEEGLEIVGYPLSAVGRVVVTHGHIDHDGGCFDVVARSGAELWAHEIYNSLLGVSKLATEEGYRQRSVGFTQLRDQDFEDRLKEYYELGSRLVVTNPVTDGLSPDGFTYYYTPGHSPDELCILFQRALFSGDHILPQITPHPSVGHNYARYRHRLPPSYQAANECYGLKAYLRSLKRVSTLGDDVSVMPAHRAFFGGKFNLIGLERAGEIIDHHRERFHSLLDMMRGEPQDLDSLTRKYFTGRQLDGRNYFLAFSEVVSHIELLEEAGDVTMEGDEKELACWNGTEHFRGFIDEL